MSEVWEAHDLELDRHVALKLLGLAADRARFQREAQAVAGLSHPHICRLYDYGEVDGRPYMVLELLTGGSLEDRLSGDLPLPDRESERIAREVASALGHAHAQGVLHRDVKPTNVLLDSDGSAKLADFGIARVAEASTLTEDGTLLGTAAYISPEQSRGEPVTPATDVYAFGVILYRLLTGRLPFEAESALEVAGMHATRELPPIASLRPDAPENLERLATRALAKRSEERPADGNALLAELDEPTLENGSATAVDEDRTRIIEFRRRRRFEPRLFAAGAVLAALGLAGATAAVLLTPESSKAPVLTSETGPKAPSTQGESGPPAASTTDGTTAAKTTASAPTRTSTTVRGSTQLPTAVPMTTAIEPPPTDVTVTVPTIDTTLTETTEVTTTVP